MYIVVSFTCNTCPGGPNDVLNNGVTPQGGIARCVESQQSGPPEEVTYIEWDIYGSCKSIKKFNTMQYLTKKFNTMQYLKPK